MNSAQVTAFQLGICVKNSKSCVLQKSIVNSFPRIRSISIRDKSLFGLKSLKPLRAGGKGMSENSDENSPWQSITNAMDKFKGQPIEEVLRKQIQKGEYLDNGGSGVKPPGGGGGEGGSGGGSPNGPGGSDDEESYDTRQTIFASGALLSLYIYLIMGKELLRTIFDFLRFIVGLGKTSRIKRILVRLGKLYKSTKRRKITDEHFLEKAILNTPTWWYDPQDFRTAVKNYYASDADE